MSGGMTSPTKKSGTESTVFVAGGGGDGGGGGCGGRKQLAAKVTPSAGKPHRKQRVKKMQIIVKSAQLIMKLWKVPIEEVSDDLRYFVRLRVEPTLTIAALKSMLKSYQWAPKENLVIVSEDGKIQLNDDSFTVGDYGVKEKDTLLVCGEDGPFTFYIYSNMDMRTFQVSIGSCFNKICDVKEEICQIKGVSPAVQVLTLCNKSAPLQDDTPLVALGVVKPYMEEMEYAVPRLKLAKPLRRWDKYGNAVTRDLSISRW